MKNWNTPDVEELAINATAEDWGNAFGECDSYNDLNGNGRCDHWNAGHGVDCPYHKNKNGKGYCMLKSAESAKS